MNTQTMQSIAWIKAVNYGFHLDMFWTYVVAKTRWNKKTTWNDANSERLSDCINEYAVVQQELR